MGTPRKTKTNPYGLTIKQRLVINEAIDTVKKGKKLNLTAITDKYYRGNNSASISTQNSNKLNYREALLKGLTAGNIIGHNSKVETRLQEGLDAVVHNGKTGKKAVAYETRLRYAQEINKITGVYAPQQSNTARFNLNVDATQEQMDTRIRGIQEQLADTT